MLHVAVAVDGAHPHVVRVPDTAVGVRVLLAKAPHNHLPILHGGPLRLLPLLRVPISFHQDEPRNRLISLDHLVDNASAVIERVQAVVELKQCAQFHSTSRFAELREDLLVLQPVNGVLAILLPPQLRLLQDRLPLPLLVVLLSTVRVQIRNHHQFVGFVTRHRTRSSRVHIGSIRNSEHQNE